MERMIFVDISGNETLWTVRFEGETENEFMRVFQQWNDAVWLRQFFKENIDDLSAYFKITDINQVVRDTVEDSEVLRCLILDLSPEELLN